MPSNDETAEVSFVLQSKATLEENFPPPGESVAHAELAQPGESLIARFEDSSRVTQKSSEPIVVDGYEGSVREWIIRDSELTTQLDGYLADGVNSRQFRILHLPSIDNEQSLTFLIDSNISNADQVFNRIVESLNNL
jgi:uncharacterized glyoxalase superfamily protein PhnB